MRIPPTPIRKKISINSVIHLSTSNKIAETNQQENNGPYSSRFESQPSATDSITAKQLKSEEDRRNGAAAWVYAFCAIRTIGPFLCANGLLRVNIRLGETNEFLAAKIYASQTLYTPENLLFSQLQQFLPQKTHQINSRKSLRKYETFL